MTGRRRTQARQTANGCVSPLSALAAALVIAAPGFAGAQAADPPELAFRRQVTAVFADAVLLADGDSEARRLPVGEVWRDGWRLEAVTEGAARLRRGTEVRSVDFSAWPTAEQTQTAGGAGPLTLTNAVPGGPRTVAAERGPTPQTIALMEAGTASVEAARADFDRLRTAGDPRAADALRLVEEAERSFIEEMRAAGVNPGVQ